MRRIFAAFFIACILLAAIVAAAPWWLNSEHLRGKITSALEQVTGRQVSFQGNARVTLSPFFGIRLSDLVVENQGSHENEEPLLRAETALINIEPLSAIFGTISISNLELQRPKLTLLKTGDGYANWQIQSGSSETPGENIIPEGGTPVEIWVRDGALRYSDEISGTTETASNLTGKIDWPGDNIHFSFDGSAVWRNENVELGVSIDNLGSLMGGQDSDISVSFSSEPITLNFDGSANLQAGIYANGSLDAKSPSISRLNDLFGLGLETSNIIGDWGAKGELELKPGTLLLTDASVVANGNPATGVVRFATGELGTSKLDGTLALSELDLTGVATRQFLDTLSANISRENLAVDLRLSAEQVSIGKAVLSNVASTVSNGTEGFKIDLSDAELLNGRAFGKVSISENEGDYLLSVFLDARNIELKDLETLYGGASLRLDTNGDFHIELATPLPKNDEGLVFSGSVELTTKSGTLAGITLPLILDPDDDRTMQVEKISGSSGSTEFDALNLKILVFDNSGFMQKSTLHADEYQLQLSGITNFSSGSLALQGKQTGEAGAPLERLQIGGTIFEPLITIRRTEQVQPKVEDSEPAN